MKRILVTGATGQTGSAVIAALCAFDCIVVSAAVRDGANASALKVDSPVAATVGGSTVVGGGSGHRSFFAAISARVTAMVVSGPCALE